MSILENAVNQAIEDFDGIQKKGNIPDGVPTSEYDEYMGGVGEVDQDFNPESQNAQSGIAVSKALDERIRYIETSGLVEELPNINPYTSEFNSYIEAGMYHTRIINGYGTDTVAIGLLLVEKLSNSIIQSLIFADQTYTRMKSNSGAWSKWNVTSVTKDYIDEKIGDIDNALDEIIALQNSILGVSE